MADESITASVQAVSKRLAENPGEAELKVLQLKLEIAKARIELDKLKPWNRAKAGLAAALGAAIPIVIAVVGAAITLRGTFAQTDAEIRQKFAELALTDVRGPSDVALRLRVLEAFQPSLKAEFDALTGGDDAAHVFQSSNAAKLYVFEAVTAKAECAEQVAALWGQLFGPTALSVGWEPTIRLEPCPSAESPETPAPSLAPSP